MHRNDALDNVQRLQEELAYLAANPSETPDDAVAYHAAAVRAFENYFVLAGDEDKRAARALVGGAR